MTQRDPGIANLANQTWMPADEPDALLFAEAHFSQAINHIRLCSQLFDANYGAGLDRRERAGRRFLATSIGWLIFRSLVRLFQREQATRPAQASQGWI